MLLSNQCVLFEKEKKGFSDTDCQLREAKKRTPGPPDAYDDACTDLVFTIMIYDYSEHNFYPAKGKLTVYLVSYQIMLAMIVHTMLIGRW